MSVLRDIEPFVAFLERRWHSKVALIVLVVALVVGSAYALSRIEVEGLSGTDLGIILGVAIGAVCLWYVTTRPPKAKSDCIGIGFAFVDETDGTDRSLLTGFRDALAQLMTATAVLYPFDLVQFGRFHAQQIIESGDPSRLMHKSGCHFLFYGKLLERRLEGTPNHVLVMDGMVTHSSVATKTKKRLANEFRELLPQRIAISKENDVFSFEITAPYLNQVARYIIAIASALSGDFNYAQLLFEGLRADLAASTDGSSGTLKIKQRVPQRLALVYRLQAIRMYDQWRDEHKIEQMEEIAVLARKMLAMDPGARDAYNMLAIHKFVTEGKADEALTLIRKCRGSSDHSWRFGEAFLLAHLGRLDAARKSYKIAARKSFRPGLPNEVEEFIWWVLESDPDRCELYYCLGVINYQFKGDHTRAKSDFSKFLELCPEDRHRYARSLATRFLETLED